MEFGQKLEDRLAFLKQEIDVDLRDLLEDEDMEEDVRLRAIKYKIARGLLMAWGRGDPKEGFYLPEDFDVDSFLRTHIETDACGVTDNVMLSTAAVENLRSAKGSEIVIALYKIDEVCNMVIAHKDNFDESVIGEMVEVGVDAFTAVGGAFVGAALSQGVKIASAVMAGILAGGVELVSLAVGALASVFIALSSAQRTCLGIVINNTAQDILVDNWIKGVDGEETGGLFMKHGKMLEFMEDDSVSGQSAVQVKARPVQGGAHAGLYLMSKKSCAWIGCEGTMRLKVGQDTLDFLSSCPLSQDNRVNLQLNSDKSLSEVHDLLYDDKRDSASVSNGRISALAKVNDYGGSPSYAVVIIDAV